MCISLITLDDYLLAGVIIFLVLVFLFVNKVLVPSISLSKLAKEKYKKIKKEDNLKLFYQIFGFEFKVEEIENEKLVSRRVEKFFEDSIRDDVFLYEIKKTLSIKKTNDEKFFQIFAKKYDFLKEVNYGLGFESIELLERFISLKLGARKNLLEEASRLSKFFYPSLPLGNVDRFLKGIQIN